MSIKAPGIGKREASGKGRDTNPMSLQSSTKYPHCWSPVTGGKVNTRLVAGVSDTRVLGGGKFLFLHKLLAWRGGGWGGGGGGQYCLLDRFPGREGGCVNVGMRKAVCQEWEVVRLEHSLGVVPFARP